MKDKVIQVFEPQMGAEELMAVGRVMLSKWVGRGKVTKEFEVAWAAHVGSPSEFVRSISCATEGLFQSMALLGVGKGDEVVLPTVSFVGAANAVEAVGAKPVFCDVDPRTLNASAKDVMSKVTKRTKAVILTHYGGMPNATAIYLAAEFRIDEMPPGEGVKLVEDAACAPFSSMHGKACGTFGDLGIWSFDAMKIMSAGDGGMVWCRDHRRINRLAEETYLGLGSESGAASKAKERWWEFEVSCAGRRAIMNDISSAIGLEQLRKLPTMVGRRKQIYYRYVSALEQISFVTLPPPAPVGMKQSHYLFWIQLPSQRVRDGLAAHLRRKGVYTTFRYYPLHLVKFYGSMDALPGAEDAAKRTLCLPLHSGLSDQDVERVLDAVWKFRKWEM